MYRENFKITDFFKLHGKGYKLISIVSPILVLLLWEGLVRVGALDDRFFPPPTRVFVILFNMTLSGEIFVHLGASLKRVGAGFLLGGIPGVLIGLLMGWSKGIRAFLDPIVAALYPIPKVSLLPLLMIIFGLGDMSKIVTVAFAGFFVVLITTAQGVIRIDPILIQAAENYGARGWNLFAKVILPATLPAIFTSLRLSLGVSLLVIVAAEFVASNEGIGYLIWISWSTLAVGDMYAGLIVVALLGLLTTTGLERLGKVLMPWGEDIQNRTR